MKICVKRKRTNDSLVNEGSINAKRRNENVRDTFDSVCSVFNGKFCNSDESFWDSSIFRPATEKEINEFLSTMNENGYVWDIRNCKLIYVK